MVPESSDLVEAVELASMKTRDRNFILFLYYTLDEGIANQGRVLFFAAPKGIGHHKSW